MQIVGEDEMQTGLWFSHKIGLVVRRRGKTRRMKFRLGDVSSSPDLKLLLSKGMQSSDVVFY